eukprot:2974637-Lingulodinium_polyedra.AAC.1
MTIARLVWATPASQGHAERGWATWSRFPQRVRDRLDGGTIAKQTRLAGSTGYWVDSDVPPAPKRRRQMKQRSSEKVHPHLLRAWGAT